MYNVSMEEYACAYTTGVGIGIQLPKGSWHFRLLCLLCSTVDGLSGV